MNKLSSNVTVLWQEDKLALHLMKSGLNLFCLIVQSDYSKASTTTSCWECDSGEKEAEQKEQWHHERWCDRSLHAGHLLERWIRTSTTGEAFAMFLLSKNVFADIHALEIVGAPLKNKNRFFYNFTPVETEML